MGYENGDIAKIQTRYDIVLDVGGSWALGRLRRLLSPGGALVLIGGEGGGRSLGSVRKWIHALALGPIVGQKLRPLSTTPNNKDLLFLRSLVESGKMMPIIDKTFALREVPEAFRYLESGNSRGKIVIAT